MMRKAIYILILVVSVSAILAMSSITGLAFAHPHLVVTPDISDPDQMRGNPVVLTLGHGNEPSYGAKPGIHDGKHNVELSIEDAATTLPIPGANLTLDKYYFRDFRAFDRASSPDSATEVEKGIPLGGVFGEPGVYSTRQIVKDGIYGYRVYGTIDYFGMAQIPIDSTVFCTTPQGNTSKFNSPGWSGSYGCVNDIDSLLFPENNEVRGIDSGAKNSAELKQASLTYDTNNVGAAGAIASPMPGLDSLQILAAGIPAAGLAALFGMRKFKRRNEGER